MSVCAACSKIRFHLITLQHTPNYEDVQEVLTWSNLNVLPVKLTWQWGAKISTYHTTVRTGGDMESTGNQKARWLQLLPHRSVSGCTDKMLMWHFGHTHTVHNHKRYEATRIVIRIKLRAVRTKVSFAEFRIKYWVCLTNVRISRVLRSFQSLQTVYLVHF